MNTPTKAQLEQWLLQPLNRQERSFVTGYRTPFSMSIDSLHANLSKFLQPEPDPYAELKAARAEGKVIQFYANQWYDYNPGTDIKWDNEVPKRIKPEPWMRPKEVSEMTPSERFALMLGKQTETPMTPVNVPTNMEGKTETLTPGQAALDTYCRLPGGADKWEAVAQAAISARLAQVSGLPSEEECLKSFGDAGPIIDGSIYRGISAIRTLLLTAFSAQQERDKEQIAILQSQVDNADVTWQQQKLCTDAMRKERDTLAAKLEEAEKNLGHAKTEIGIQEKRADEAEEALRECCIICGFDPSDGEGTSPSDVVKAVGHKVLDRLIETSPLPPTFHILLDPTRDTKQEGDECRLLAEHAHWAPVLMSDPDFLVGFEYRRLVSQPYYLRANEMLKKQVEEQHGLYVESAGIANSEKLRANAAEQRAEKAEDSASEITSQRDVFKNKLIQIGYENNELRAQLAAKEKELGEEKDRSHKLSQEKGELFARCVAKDLELSTLRPVSLKDRRPTKKDANTQGLVQWHWSNGNVGLHHWDTNFPHSGPVAWCSIPKPPQPDTLRQEFEEWYRERFPGIRNAEHETTCWESYQAARAGKEKA